MFRDFLYLSLEVLCGSRRMSVDPTQNVVISRITIYSYSFYEYFILGNAMRAFPDISRICRQIIYIQVEPSSIELLAREITLYQYQ